MTHIGSTERARTAKLWRKHWHGASADRAMTHIAIQEVLDGKVGEWLEKVNDEQ
jgi:hypothetical protein